MKMNLLSEFMDGSLLLERDEGVHTGLGRWPAVEFCDLGGDAEIS